MGADTASQAFDTKKLDFINLPYLYDRLVVRISGHCFPWVVVASIVLGMISFGKEQIFERKGITAVHPIEKTVTGDPSNASVASTGSWKLWPFAFRRSNSSKARQPDLNDGRNPDAENASESAVGMDGDKDMLSPKGMKKTERVLTPTSEQLASLNLKEGRNTVTFRFSTAMLGKQEVVCCDFYLGSRSGWRFSFLFD